MKRGNEVGLRDRLGNEINHKKTAGGVLPSDSKGIVRGFFTEHPPGEGDTAGDILGEIGMFLHSYEDWIGLGVPMKKYESDVIKDILKANSGTMMDDLKTKIDSILPEYEHRLSARKTAGQGERVRYNNSVPISLRGEEGTLVEGPDGTCVVQLDDGRERPARDDEFDKISSVKTAWEDTDQQYALDDWLSDNEVELVDLLGESTYFSLGDMTPEQAAHTISDSAEFGQGVGADQLAQDLMSKCARTASDNLQVGDHVSVDDNDVFGELGEGTTGTIVKIYDDGWVNIKVDQNGDQLSFHQEDVTLNKISRQKKSSPEAEKPIFGEPTSYGGWDKNGTPVERGATVRTPDGQVGTATPTDGQQIECSDVNGQTYQNAELEVISRRRSALNPGTTLDPMDPDDVAIAAREFRNNSEFQLWFDSVNPYEEFDEFDGESQVEFYNEFYNTKTSRKKSSRKTAGIPSWATDAYGDILEEGVWYEEEMSGELMEATDRGLRMSDSLNVTPWEEFEGGQWAPGLYPTEEDPEALFTMGRRKSSTLRVGQRIRFSKTTNLSLRGEAGVIIDKAGNGRYRVRLDNGRVATTTLTPSRRKTMARKIATQRRTSGTSDNMANYYEAYVREQLDAGNDPNDVNAVEQWFKSMTRPAQYGLSGFVTENAVYETVLEEASSGQLPRSEGELQSAKNNVKNFFSEFDTYSNRKSRRKTVGQVLRQKKMAKDVDPADVEEVDVETEVDTSNPEAEKSQYENGKYDSQGGSNNEGTDGENGNLGWVAKRRRPKKASAEDAMRLAELYVKAGLIDEDKKFSQFGKLQGQTAYRVKEKTHLLTTALKTASKFAAEEDDKDKDTDQEDTTPDTENSSNDSTQDDSDQEKESRRRALPRSSRRRVNPSMSERSSSTDNGNDEDTLLFL